MGTGWSVTATMIAGIALWGGVGYVIDRLIGAEHVFFAFGTILGAAGSIYIVYLRYGKGDRGDS
jgi:F0F1-type ATP synthase assembly protein I